MWPWPGEQLDERSRSYSLHLVSIPAPPRVNPTGSGQGEHALNTLQNEKGCGEVLPASCQTVSLSGGSDGSRKEICSLYGGENQQ